MRMERYDMKNRVILTDCDGVLLDWINPFTEWMTALGNEPVDMNAYNIGVRYGITNERKEELVRFFNESAAMRNLPPLRDAIKYVRKLHEEHGFVFHCITSMTINPDAQQLRRENLADLFGKTVFPKFKFVDTGADKDDALEEYRNTNCWWVEDKVENAELGCQMGLDPIVVAHNYNKGHPWRYNNWKEIYEEITK